MQRTYQLKQRAERRDETRQRIIEATLALHTSVGPARTTISAIAERAGVERLTVYRHFPDERALFTACSALGRAKNPPPDPTPWRSILDPETRLQTALTEIYAYYRRAEQRWGNLTRDAQIMPVVREAMEPLHKHWALMREVLEAGWSVESSRRDLLHAALGHALTFSTWQSLVQEQELAEEAAIELLVRMIRCITSEGAS
jgi:AcrR family transcriptional regulator